MGRLAWIALFARRSNTTQAYTPEQQECRNRISQNLCFSPTTQASTSRTRCGTTSAGWVSRHNLTDRLYVALPDSLKMKSRSFDASTQTYQRSRSGTGLPATSRVSGSISVPAWHARSAVFVFLSLATCRLLWCSYRDSILELSQRLLPEWYGETCYWHGLVGRHFEVAKAVIRAQNPNMIVVDCGQSTYEDCDYDTRRVRIYTNHKNIVKYVPSSG